MWRDRRADVPYHVESHRALYRTKFRHPADSACDGDRGGTHHAEESKDAGLDRQLRSLQWEPEKHGDEQQNYREHRAVHTEEHRCDAQTNGHQSQTRALRARRHHPRRCDR
jgi:hypothetical protein